MIIRMDVWENTDTHEIRWFLEHSVHPMDGPWIKRGTIEVGIVPAF